MVPYITGIQLLTAEIFVRQDGMYRVMLQWTTLEMYLQVNGYNYDGSTTGNKYAKALASSTGWNFYGTEGAAGNTDYADKRNASGFTALPGGVL